MAKWMESPMATPRSPNYPSLSLEEALQAVAPALKAENRNKMGRLTLARHLGYSSLNGRALSKIGAVRAYGLIDGGSDELRVSDDAVVCLRAPQDSTERGAALERCATRPALFKAIRADFPDSLPSAENLGYWLAKNGYTEKASGKAAETYLKTMRLVEPAMASTDLGARASRPDGTPPTFGVGDLIQVEIGGALQLEEPSRIREIREHGGQIWLLTEASDAWVQVQQAVMVAKGNGPSSAPPPPGSAVGSPSRAPNKEGWREERLLDDAGDEIFISYSGEPTAARYEFIRDYLDFKLARLRKSDALPVPS
jgi:hypothetical protein